MARKGISRIERGGKRRPEALTAAKHIMAFYRDRAANKGVPFSLEFLEFFELIKRDCIYCGVRPSNTHKRKGGYAPFRYQGIDRVINSDGYTLENSVPCCAACNSIKSNILTAEEMLAAMTAIKKIRK